MVVNFVAKGIEECSPFAANTVIHIDNLKVVNFVEKVEAAYRLTIANVVSFLEVSKFLTCDKFVVLDLKEPAPIKSSSLKHLDLIDGSFGEEHYSIVIVFTLHATATSFGCDVPQQSTSLSHN